MYNNISNPVVLSTWHQVEIKTMFCNNIFTSSKLFAKFKINYVSKTIYFFRLNGHDRDSLHTYGMVAGLFNSGLALGATTGPISVGAIIDALDFTWAQTILGFADLTMVSNI